MNDGPYDDPSEQDVPDDVLDAVFAIECPSLPVDHAYALFQAVQSVLPWFADEPLAGLHDVHGAASGAGWVRPEGAGALLQLSHRARLALRLPKHRVDDANALLGRTLDVAGWPMAVEKVTVRKLSRITTVFARYVVFEQGGDESAFLAAASSELRVHGIEPGTILCGLGTPLATPRRTLETRSLLLSGLTPAQSLTVQQRGLGAERKVGCGLFIPHKGIADLRPRSN
jgi:CRISPR-associated protein Cas6